jgi:hypothetical protein
VPATAMRTRWQVSVCRNINCITSQ